jgi:hypothetical protein
VYKVKIKGGADTKARKKKIKTLEKEEGYSQRRFVERNKLLMEEVRWPDDMSTQE